jgi:hypothetical protein
MAEMWYESLHMTQASAQSKEDKADRRNYLMAWYIFAMTLTVPFVPFALPCAWRLGRYYYMLRPAGSSRSDTSDGVCANEDSVSMPGTAPPLLLCLFWQSMVLCV